MNQFYDYVFYLWYRFAKIWSNPNPKYYACFAVTFIESILIALLVKYLMYIEILALNQSSEKLLFLFFIFSALVLFLIHWKVFVKDERILKVIDIYKRQEKENRKELLIHSAILVILSLILVYATVLFPVHYVH